MASTRVFPRPARNVNSLASNQATTVVDREDGEWGIRDAGGGIRVDLRRATWKEPGANRRNDVSDGAVGGFSGCKTEVGDLEDISQNTSDMVKVARPPWRDGDSHFGYREIESLVPIRSWVDVPLVDLAGTGGCCYLRDTGRISQKGGDGALTVARSDICQSAYRSPDADTLCSATRMVWAALHHVDNLKVWMLLTLGP